MEFIINKKKFEHGRFMFGPDLIKFLALPYLKVSSRVCK